MNESRSIWGIKGCICNRRPYCYCYSNFKTLRLFGQFIFSLATGFRYTYKSLDNKLKTRDYRERDDDKWGKENESQRLLRLLFFPSFITVFLPNRGVLIHHVQSSQARLHPDILFVNRTYVFAACTFGHDRPSSFIDWKTCLFNDQKVGTTCTLRFRQFQLYASFCITYVLPNLSDDYTCSWVCGRQVHAEFW